MGIFDIFYNKKNDENKLNFNKEKISCFYINKISI